MSKQGRPGIPYEQFVEAWEALLEEGRAGNNAVHAIIGGSKSTIASYRERYEREQSANTLSVLKEIELPDAIHQALAKIKVKEINALEQDNKQLKLRIDEHLTLAKELEGKAMSATQELEDAKKNYEADVLSMERKLAVAKARIEDMEARESKLLLRSEKLAEQANQAKQEAAVAKKETQMLREQKK